MTGRNAGRSLLLAVIASAALAPAPAHAAVVHCGDTLTKNTTFSNDLVNCPADGVHIGADGIVVNLNGRFIKQSNGTQQTLGVDFGGHNGVTLTHGRIIGFGIGLSVDGDHNTIDAISFDGGDNQSLPEGANITGGNNTISHSGQSHTSYGIIVRGPADVVTSDTASGFGSGIVLEGPGDSVTTSTVTDFQRGIELFAPGTATNNVVTNSTDIQFSPVGIDVEAPATVKNNKVTGNRNFLSIGVALIGGVSSGSLIQGNQAMNNATGFTDVIGGNSVFKGNLASRNTVGFSLEETMGDQLINNIAGTGNPNSGGTGGNTGYGILISGSDERHAQDSVIQGNSVHGNGSDGIFATLTTNTTLLANAANQNGGDGIHLGDGSGTDGGLIKSNNAKYNQGFGIRVLDAAKDGGNNHAFGNVQGQCLGVSCTP